MDVAAQPADVQVEAQGGVADHLVDHALGGVDVVDVAERSARRGVDVEAGAAAEQGDAKEMGAVADDDDVAEVFTVGDGGEALDLLLGVDGLSFGDDFVKGNAVGEEVIAADAALGLAGVEIAAAAERDDDRRHAAVVERDGFVQAGVQDG